MKMIDITTSTATSVVYSLTSGKQRRQVWERARFSTVAGEPGAASFALKFYTADGNWT